MKKIVLDLDGSGQVNDIHGAFIGTVMAGAYVEYEEPKSSGEIVLALAKQGFTADEIVKLKNADLL